MIQMYFEELLWDADMLCRLLYWINWTTVHLSNPNHRLHQIAACLNKGCFKDLWNLAQVIRYFISCQYFSVYQFHNQGGEIEYNSTECTYGCKSGLCLHLLSLSKLFLNEFNTNPIVIFSEWICRVSGSTFHWIKSWTNYLYFVIECLPLM